MPAAKTAKADTPMPSFEDALQELEQLADGMEEGAAPLEDMLAQYKRAAALLKHCRSQLQAVEEQVRVIDGGLSAASSARDGDA